MKRSELQKCIGCGKQLNQVTFYQLEARYMVFDPMAIRRAIGLEMMVGSSIAEVLGPDDDLAEEVSKYSVCVCLKCATERPLASLLMEES